MPTLAIAKPWWVNLLILVPVALYLLSIRKKIPVRRRRLLLIAVFGVAFAFVEAAVVVYLRAAAGLWPNPPAQAIYAFPKKLLMIERYREAATIIMLGAIAILAGQRIREKAVAFLWAFAFWDMFYYLWLRVTIGWPASLIDSDLLFLLPVPWIAQVWFPVLVCVLTITVIWSRSQGGTSRGEA